MKKRLSLSALATLAAFGVGAFALSGHSLAQGYPNKPVKAIISFPAGSSTDIVGRIVMQKVAEGWGQPAVIENRGGAGGSIAAAAVAKSAADGYTLLIDSGARAVTPSMYATLPYDPAKDFIDIVPRTGGAGLLALQVGDGTGQRRPRQPRQDQLRLGRHRQRHPLES